MPYRFQTSGLTIPRKFDARVKLTSSDKELMRALRVSEGLSQRQLALMFGVSRRLVTFVLDPDKLIANKAARAARGGTASYYDKEKHAAYTRKHRRGKQKLALAGLLEGENEG
ncbi:MAG: hypothetical protein KAI66_26500 [Lentisphaeria bacterium]|nr:hypothetical protein [Lentisphaeria bacterium]